MLKLRVGEIPSKHTSTKWKPRKPAWDKATEEIIQNYREDLLERLLSMPTPDCLSCSDPHCSIPSHTSDRDSYMLDILCSVVKSTHTVLPLAGGSMGRSRKSGFCPGKVPGWTEIVEPLAMEATFWYAVWVSAGRPNNGELHTAMARSRNKYHYGIRRVKG